MDSGAPVVTGEVRFTDGFDGPDPVAFGLGPAQLLAVAAGLLIAYALVSGPLPLAASAPLALLAMSAGAAAGWLRVDGRSGVEWVGLAVRFVLRPRTGVLEWDLHRPGEAHTPAAATGIAAPRFQLQGGAPRWITFFSLSGGSGRTTIATELACVLAARGGIRVALIDANPLNPDVATRLGIPEPTPLDFARAVRPRVTHPTGVVALPGSSLAVAPAAQAAEGDHILAAAEQLVRDGIEVLVFDIGSDLGPVALRVLGAVHRIYVVMTPSPRGIHDAYRSSALLRRSGLRGKLAYVVNRSRDGFDAGVVMGDLNGDVAAAIPEDGLLLVAEHHHRPLSISGDGPVPAAVATLASHVCAARPVAPAPGP